jgi:hypothetical protein
MAKADPRSLLVVVIVADRGDRFWIRVGGADGNDMVMMRVFGETINPVRPFKFPLAEQFNQAT